MTWFGIWPIPFVPVGLFTSSKPLAASETSTFSISWGSAGTAALRLDPNGVILRLEDGRTLKPLRFTYTIYAEHKPTVLETSQPVTTTGYRQGSITYDLDGLPDKFTVILQAVSVDDQEITVPPLNLELQEGSHYSTFAM